jgi:recombination protein RecA
MRRKGEEMAKKKNNKRGDPLKLFQKLQNDLGSRESTVYSTGILGLDDILGGGIHSGKMMEIHSEAGCGKTTISLFLLKLLMSTYGVKTALFDIEKSVSPSLKESLGLHTYEEELDEQDRPMFLHWQLSTFSEAFDALKTVLANGYKFIVWDSMTMTVSDAALDKEVGTEEGGLHARAQSRILPLVKREAFNADATVIILNQMRTNMGGSLGGGSNWNRGSKPAGGKALEFATDIRICLQGIASMAKGNEPPHGLSVRATTTKIKVAKPFQSTTLPLHFGKGINILEHIRDQLVERNAIKGSNGWFEVPGLDSKIHGDEALLHWVATNSEEAFRLLGATYLEDGSA